MRQLEPSTPSVETESKRRSVSSRLADWGDRVARALPVHGAAGFEPRLADQLYEPGHAAIGQIPEPPAAEPPDTEPDTVDDYFHQRERELAELQSRERERGLTELQSREPDRGLAELPPRTPEQPDIDAELARIGEETSAILVAAHDQAQDMIRRAQAQADHCVAEAASRAMTITQQADRRVHELDNEAEALWRERAALLEDVQQLAAAFSALAEQSVARFPPEPSQADTPSMPTRARPAAESHDEMEP
jgi:hypothetical protein